MQTLALMHVLELATEQAERLGLSGTTQQLVLLQHKAAAEIYDRTGDTRPLRLAMGQ